MPLYYKIKFAENETFYRFLEALYGWCLVDSYFRVGIGVVYLTLRPDNPAHTLLAIEDELFNGGLQGIHVVKQLRSKPKPERSFVGSWITLAEWKSHSASLIVNGI